MKLAVVVVHYFAGVLTRQALTILRAQAREVGAEVETVVVDHGGTAADREELQSLAATDIRRPGENGGFAKGVNLGIASTEADRILVINPDVRMAPGGLAAMLAALASGADVVGPRFYWDDERRFVLPPAEERSFASEMFRALSGRSPSWARLARRRWRRQAQCHWRAQATLASFDLSGAALLLTRRAWNRVGPFDETFRLYFEETDWLRRARKLRLRSVYAPSAIAIHDVGASTRREPQAQLWFEESAAYFRRKHYGRSGARLLEGLAARSPEPGRTADPATPVRTTPVGSEVWFEVSPHRCGFPAVAERFAGREREWLPGVRLSRALAEGDLWLRVVDDHGWESAPRRLVGPASEGAPA